MRVGDTANCLVIRRVLSAENGSNTVLCRPKQITVLSDEDGVNMPIYQKALSGEKIEDTIILEYNGLNFDPISQCRIGFGEKLPDDIGIREYFEQIGIPSEEIERLIDSCELRKYLYYTCSQLSSTQARQVQLMGALRGKSKIVLLNDPFQPFSGRWREFFAEEFTNALQQSDRMLVVMNLSFVPQGWLKKEVIHYANISKILPNKKQKAEAVKNPDAELKQLLNEEPAALERQAKATLKISIPEPVNYAFQSTVDFIFEPLAGLVKFFGRYGAVGIILGMALIMIIGTLIMVPNLRDLQSLQRELISKFSDPPPENISTDPLPKNKFFAKEEPKHKSADPKEADQAEIEPASQDLDESKPIDQGLAAEDISDGTTNSLNNEEAPVIAKVPDLKEPAVNELAAALDSTDTTQFFSPQCLAANDDLNLWVWGDAWEQDSSLPQAADGQEIPVSM